GFRENWEIYRAEYWERENERRALLRHKLEVRAREYARQRWGALWWLPWHRAEISRHLGRERPRPAVANHRYHVEPRQHRSGSVRRGSTSSSRSPTPTVEGEDPGIAR